MFTRILFIIPLIFASTTFGDWIVSTGAPFGYLAPNPSYAPGELILEITIGYGDESNTIGDGLWHTGPGIYDLSNPDLPGFLEYATNGLEDDVSVSVTDIFGYSETYIVHGLEALLLYGSSLPQYTINGVLLEVLDVYYAGESIRFELRRNSRSISSIRCSRATYHVYVLGDYNCSNA